MEKNSEQMCVPPFLAWRQRLGLSRPDAARLLGRTTRNIQTYDTQRELPDIVRLAMAALEFLPSWRLAELNIDWRKLGRLQRHR